MIRRISISISLSLFLPLSQTLCYFLTNLSPFVSLIIIIIVTLLIMTIIATPLLGILDLDGI